MEAILESIRATRTEREYDEPEFPANGFELGGRSEFFVHERFNQTPAFAIPGLRDKLLSLRCESNFRRLNEAINAVSAAQEGLKSDFIHVDDYLRDTPLRELTRVFSPVEMAALRTSSPYTAKKSWVTSGILQGTPYILRKINLGAWHNGFCRLGWNQMVAAWNAINDFSMEQPHFTVRFDATVGCNSKGYSECTRTFLDSELALVVEYKGRHAITLGFHVTVIKGKPVAFLEQIQLKQKKGNRFLFSMRPGFMEYCAYVFVKAFAKNGFEVRMVKGAHTRKRLIDGYADAVERANRYRSENKEMIREFTQKLESIQGENGVRIQKLYDCPFRALLRRSRCSTPGHTRVRLR